MHSLSGVAWRSVLDVRLRMASWLWLGSAFGVVAFVCFLVFSPPSSPYSGRQGLFLNSFSIERTVQCDGCLMWGLGWRAGLVAGLRVGQAYGGVPTTWVWVVGVSPQILEHPTSICDTGVNLMKAGRFLSKQGQDQPHFQLRGIYALNQWPRVDLLAN